MDILPVLKNRKTADSFDGQPVDRSALERILEAGRLAPSAKNRQPWRFVVLTQDGIIKKIAESCFGDQRMFNAAYIVAICTTNIQYTMPNGQKSHILDAAFATSHMELQATHEGLATIMSGTFDEQAIKKLLSVPYSMRIILLLAIGHSNDKAKMKLRLHPDRIISYEHW